MFIWNQSDSKVSRALALHGADMGLILYAPI